MRGTRKLVERRGQQIPELREGLIEFNGTEARGKVKEGVGEGTRKGKDEREERQRGFQANSLAGATEKMEESVNQRECVRTSKRERACVRERRLLAESAKLVQRTSLPATIATAKC